MQSVLVEMFYHTVSCLANFTLVIDMQIIFNISESQCVELSFSVTRNALWHEKVFVSVC